MGAPKPLPSSSLAEDPPGTDRAPLSSKEIGLATINFRRSLHGTVARERETNPVQVPTSQPNFHHASGMRLEEFRNG